MCRQFHPKKTTVVKIGLQRFVPEKLSTVEVDLIEKRVGAALSFFAAAHELPPSSSSFNRGGKVLGNLTANVASFLSTGEGFGAD